jgi:hypothetical protein
MKIRPRLSHLSFLSPLRWLLAVSLLLISVAALPVLAQNPPLAKNDPAKPATQPITRLTIEVTGGDKNAVVENASVYVKYVEEHAITKDKKLELNVKTNASGVAHVPAAPTGRVLIQVIADGWKTFGRWYDITDLNQEFKIHLERPPKWY